MTPIITIYISTNADQNFGGQRQDKSIIRGVYQAWVLKAYCLQWSCENFIEVAGIDYKEILSHLNVEFSRMHTLITHAHTQHDSPENVSI